MQFYIDNIELLDQFKKDALFYAHKNLSWQKNSKFLLDLINVVSSLEVKHKESVYKVVKKFEKSRGVWFYIANTKVYRNLKRKYTNLKKKVSS